MSERRSASAGFSRQRRPLPRYAAAPTDILDDPTRRGALSRAACEIVDLAGRVVDELLRQAADPGLSLAERRGLVGIAVEVDREAARRTGTAPRTVEVAARGRAALGAEVAA